MNKLVVCCLLLFGGATLGASEYVCSEPCLNMHKEPKKLSEVISQLIWADSCELLEQTDNGWAKIQTKDSSRGWVPLSAVSSTEKRSYPRDGMAAMCISRSSNLYLFADVTLSPPILSLPYGAKLEVLREDERWAEVRLINGEVVYISRSDISLKSEPLSVDEMLAVAKSFVGVPYVWGGKSSYGFDAQGFTQILYRQMGYGLPREASEQADFVKAIDSDEVKPGDLLFFSTRSDYRINHVGIYLGNGEFIHASPENTPPSVQVSSLADPYWQLSLKKYGTL